MEGGTLACGQGYPGIEVLLHRRIGFDLFFLSMQLLATHTDDEAHRGGATQRRDRFRVSPGLDDRRESLSPATDVSCRCDSS